MIHTKLLSGARSSCLFPHCWDVRSGKIFIDSRENRRARSHARQRRSRVRDFIFRWLILDDLLWNERAAKKTRKESMQSRLWVFKNSWECLSCCHNKTSAKCFNPLGAKQHMKHPRGNLSLSDSSLSTDDSFNEILGACDVASLYLVNLRLSDK